jgi:hypothetical protein
VVVWLLAAGRPVTVASRLRTQHRMDTKSIGESGFSARMSDKDTKKMHVLLVHGRQQGFYLAGAGAKQITSDLNSTRGLRVRAYVLDSSMRMLQCVHL